MFSIYYHREYDIVSKKYLLTVPEREADWLDSHPEVNKSGLFRKTVEILMKRTEPVLSNEDSADIARGGFVK